MDGSFIYVQAVRVWTNPLSEAIASKLACVVSIEAPKGVELEEAPKEDTETQTEQPTLRVPVVKIDLPLPSAEVVATATYAAVAAVATTTLATPLFDKLKKQIQKFLQKKVDKWKENRQKKKESLESWKML